MAGCGCSPTINIDDLSLGLAYFGGLSYPFPDAFPGVFLFSYVLVPVLIFQIPLYCFADTGIEGFRGAPATLCLNTVAIDGVASIMTLAGL